MNRTSQAQRPGKRRDAGGGKGVARPSLAAVLVPTEDGRSGSQAVHARGGSPACRDEEFARVEKAFALAPDDPDVRRAYAPMMYGRAMALKSQGRFAEALPFLQRNVELLPASANAHRELGYCHAKVGHLDQAIRHYTRAINLDPDHASYYNDLGLAFFDLRMLAEAKGAFQQLLTLDPTCAAAYLHLGLIANLTGLTGMAVKFILRALELDPKCAEAHNNLGLVLREQGEIAACLSHYRQALALKPDRKEMFSGYLLALNYDPSISPRKSAEEHRRAEHVFRAPARRLPANPDGPARKLRVGYLSPDFHFHSVSYFLVPVLEAHSRDVVDVTCYHTGNIHDDMTARIRKAAGQWRNAFRMSDEDLAAQIEADGIDVLVELSGHTADNRLSMLAGRVAPIQVTYLGYPNTTGLAAMDFRVTDEIADPPGRSEDLHSEKLLRLEGGFLAYSSPAFAKDLAVGGLPAQDTGHFTFGSFNNLSKIHDDVLDCWATILGRTPGSKLILKARGLRDDRVKQRIAAAMAARGIVDGDRLILLGHALSAVDHLETYHQVDLALDPFPYNGTTTTCEALWMGVPVVTLEGNCHAGRVGTSLMSRVGLAEFVAKDKSSYIEKAVAWAENRDSLAELRKGLRAKLVASPLMDAGRVARALESAFAESWRAYLTSRAPG